MSVAFDDRAFLLDREHAIKAEKQAVDHLEHYTLLGYGLAEMAKALYHGLSQGENAISAMVLTQEQKLRLVCAALQGR